MNNIIDYKRLDKINVGHNITDAFDFHDICRTLLVRMLRRKHKNKRMNPIYTEFNPNEPNDNYPDIWMKIGKDVYVWELQSSITQEWIKKVCKTHEEVDLIIVPLDEIKEKLLDKWEISKDPFDKLKELLKDYLI
jgi:hypothetical protein